MAIAAIAGLWLFASEYADLSLWSWWYAAAIRSEPDFDAATLPWKRASPQRFDVDGGAVTVATSADPFGYQAFAILDPTGADAAALQVQGELANGGATFGMLQKGKWVAVTSVKAPGPFAVSAFARLDRRDSLMVVVANNNEGGASRLTLSSFRLYLRR